MYTVPSILRTHIRMTPQFFLVKDAEEDKEVLQKCEELIRNTWGPQTKLQWITPNHCLKLNQKTIAKSHVFIFPDFNGPAFDHLRSGNSALLLGPPAITKCLRENISIPNTPPPWIHNLAMKDLRISLSGFSSADKHRYTDLITFMGGFCSPHILRTTTHLVSNTINSMKYEMAERLRIPVMQSMWIEELWVRNQTEFVAATEDEFKNLRLPIFLNLYICSTQLSKEQNLLIERLVNENGGTFHYAMKPMDVDILLLNKAESSSEKFKAAKRQNKTCLTPDWIIDSVKSEYALPFGSYRVVTEGEVLTHNEAKAKNPDFSSSRIEGGWGNATINNSMVVSNQPKIRATLSSATEKATATKTGTSGRTINDEYYPEAIKSMDITGEAGPFLDGCNIYFSGFPEALIAKLNRLVNLCGAKRFEEVNENVTHVVVCQRDEKELKVFEEMNRGIHFVKFHWFRDSVEGKVHANEEEYSCESAKKNIVLEQQQHPSPIIQGNIEAMNSSFKRPLPRTSPELLTARPLSQNPLMTKYLNSSPDKENAMVSHHQSRDDQDRSELTRSFTSEMLMKVSQIFHGKLFAVQIAEDASPWKQDIILFGGSLVDKSFNGEVDYLVTDSLPLANFKPLHRAKEMVTYKWLEDVVLARAMIPVEYYHRVVHVTDDKLLKGVNCTVSTYGHSERTYLTLVCHALGATVNDWYRQVESPLLICPRPEGPKYKGAIKWGFPVVTKEWVLDTYKNSCLYKLKDYLVGDSKLVATYPKFFELNDRGVHKETKAPPSIAEDVIHILDSQDSPATVPPKVELKRKSEEIADLNGTFPGAKKKAITPLGDVTLPQSNLSRPFSMKNRLKLKSLSIGVKSSTAASSKSSPKPLEFGRDYLARKQLLEVLKESNNNRTPSKSRLQLPARNTFNRSIEKKEKKKSNPSTPLSEIKRRFYKDTFGEDYVNINNSSLLIINTQHLEVEKSTKGENEEEGAGDWTPVKLNSPVETFNPDAELQGVIDFIKNRKPESQEIEYLQTCPMEVPETISPDIMVGWVGKDEKLRYESSNGNLNKSMEANLFFQTSGVSSELHDSMARMIKELKGQVTLTNEKYDPRCTHLICGKVGRVQKVLCALASGKWIVSSQYIEDSFKAKRFLKEEEYELGNPKTKCDLSKLDKLEQGLARAANSWRMKIADPMSVQYQGGAFHGFVVMITSRKAGEFKSIIEAGGGRVFELEESYQNKELAKRATHYFVDRKLPFPEREVLFCKENSITVYDIQYLNEYLLNVVNKSRLQNFVLTGIERTK